MQVTFQLFITLIGLSFLLNSNSAQAFTSLESCAYIVNHGNSDKSAGPHNGSKTAGTSDEFNLHRAKGVQNQNLNQNQDSPASSGIVKNPIVALLRTLLVNSNDPATVPDNKNGNDIQAATAAVFTTPASTPENRMQLSINKNQSPDLRHIYVITGEENDLMTDFKELDVFARKADDSNGDATLNPLLKQQVLRLEGPDDINEFMRLLNPIKSEFNNNSTPSRPTILQKVIGYSLLAVTLTKFAESDLGKSCMAFAQTCFYNLSHYLNLSQLSGQELIGGVLAVTSLLALLAYKYYPPQANQTDVDGVKRFDAVQLQNILNRTLVTLNNAAQMSSGRALDDSKVPLVSQFKVEYRLTDTSGSVHKMELIMYIHWNRQPTQGSSGLSQINPVVYFITRPQSPSTETNFGEI